MVVINFSTDYWSLRKRAGCQLNRRNIQSLFWLLPHLMSNITAIFKNWLISEQFWENPKILYNHSFLGIFIPSFYKSFLLFFEDLLFFHRPSKEKSISIIYKCMTSSYIYTNISTNIIYDKRRAYHTNFSIAWTFRKFSLTKTSHSTSLLLLSLFWHPSPFYWFFCITFYVAHFGEVLFPFKQ